MKDVSMVSLLVFLWMYSASSLTTAAQPTVLLRARWTPRRCSLTATEGGSRSKAGFPGDIRPAAAEAYSWSLSRLNNSQESIRDAYSWSVDVASAAVGRAVDGLRVSQFPALVPDWMTSRLLRRVVPAASVVGEAPAQVLQYIETVVVGAGRIRYALALALVYLLEVSGPLALAACVKAIAWGRLAPRYYRTASPLISLAALKRALVTTWVTSEALFFLVCCAIAARQNVRPGAIGPLPFGRAGTVAWRRAVWQRILRDPSQSPRDFVEGWMYRKAAMATASPPRMLVRWLSAALRGHASWTATSSTTRTGRTMVEPFGVAHEELSRADLEHWLCRSLFAQPRPSALAPSDAAELATCARAHPASDSVSHATTTRTRTGQPSSAAMRLL